MLQKKHLLKNLFLRNIAIKYLLNNQESANYCKKLKVPVDLIKFINHISLNFTPFVHLININEKNKY